MADEKKYEVVDCLDSRLLELLHEDDVDTESYVQPGGDFWIDCDYLARPDGTVVDFVVVAGSEHVYQDTEFAVVPDIDMLDDVDKAALVRFMETLYRHGIYNALTTDLPHMGATTPFPAQNTWQDNIREWAKREGRYLIAFRGGVGYCYGMYDMGA